MQPEKRNKKARLNAVPLTSRADALRQGGKPSTHGGSVFDFHLLLDPNGKSQADKGAERITRTSPRIIAGIFRVYPRKMSHKKPRPRLEFASRDGSCGNSHAPRTVRLSGRTSHHRSPGTKTHALASEDLY